jgi:superfamily II DNA helicase RecQ
MRDSISTLIHLPREKEVRVLDSRADAIHQELQQVLGKQDVSFQSIEQEQALQAVLDKQTPLIVVLPTSRGKSLLFTLPAYIEESGVTVIIILYRALIDNLINQIQKCGIDCIK